MTTELRLSETELLAVARIRGMCRSGQARQVREDAGLSLAELGSSIGEGVGPPVLSRWERGLRVPSTELALSYCARLDVLMAAAP